MNLTTKVIVIIVATVTTIISLIFYLLILRFDRQIEQNYLSTARAVYKNVLITRQWISDYNGVYVLKRPGVSTNPFLENPELLTRTGDTLTLRNPAMATRELSELSKIMGGDFSFHMASLKFLNPANKPDLFESKALAIFNDSLSSHGLKEFYTIEKIGNHAYFRYFAPLFTRESCLSCHSKQGYKVGDLRGGISILLTIDDFKKAKQENLSFFLKSALFTIIFLSSLIFVALRRSVIRPLRRIENAAQRIERGEYDFELNIPQRDEIGKLANAFENMRKKIRNYTAQLKSSEKKYRSLIENSPEAVAIIDSEGHILECNSKLNHLTGYKATRLKSLNFYELIDQENRRKITSFTSNTSDAEHFETELFTADGLKIPVEIYLIRGFSLDRKDDLSFVYVRDLSERKKIEHYSIQTEKMVALGQISSGIAHEIRNPLFALNNNLDYLKKKFGREQTFREIYPELKGGIERIQNIVSAILDFARPHQPEFKRMDINEIINKSLLLVKKQSEKLSISIETQLDAGIPEVEVDPHQMEQVFINLFLNAFAAMGESGTLTIQTRALSSFVKIKIQDTGRGISPEDLERIFEPFYSKTPDGTGLGLAIVQRVLEQHHARYQVVSEPYIGTKFYVYLPYKQEQEA